MTKFHMINNLLPEGHAGHEAAIDSDSKAFASIIGRLAGVGLSAQHTAKAMALGQELKAMPVGDRREFKKAGLFDLVVIRLPD